MPRRARLIIPEVPLHIIQRGVNRCAIFLDSDDRKHYLNLLSTVAEDNLIDIHAYVLMGNHVHLLVTAHDKDSISTAMHRLGQCYVQAFNRKHKRSGTLWEGRFKSCLVDSEEYLLKVYRYIELNPVRAAMVDSAEAYRWSSARGNLGLRVDPLLSPHPVLLAFESDVANSRVYDQWLEQGTSEADLKAVRAYLQQEKALGSRRFQAMVERTLGRPASWLPRGRPARTRSEFKKLKLTD